MRKGGRRLSKESVYPEERTPARKRRGRRVRCAAAPQLGRVSTCGCRRYYKGLKNVATSRKPVRLRDEYAKDFGHDPGQGTESVVVAACTPRDAEPRSGHASGAGINQYSSTGRYPGACSGSSKEQERDGEGQESSGMSVARAASSNPREFSLPVKRGPGGRRRRRWHDQRVALASRGTNRSAREGLDLGGTPAACTTRPRAWTCSPFSPLRKVYQHRDIHASPTPRSWTWRLRRQFGPRSVKGRTRNIKHGVAISPSARRAKRTSICTARTRG